MEYASAEAVRRGGGPRPKVDERLRLGRHRGSAFRGDKPNRGGHITGRDGDREDRRVSRLLKAGSQDAIADAAGPEISRGQVSTIRDGRANKGRSTPGAALAMAKRESAAIVTSKGQKITF